MAHSSSTRPDKRSLCVFCGAQNAVDAQHLDMGTKVGNSIAQSDLRLVFGGGDCGMMGAVANAAMDGGGEVIGVFPHHLRAHEAEHTGITETIIVGSMHERKKLMFDLSDMFAILPGGFGTMDEMFEILTWRQIGLHEKPVFIFNHLGYWDPLITMMEHIIDKRFAKPVNRDFYQVFETLESMMEAVNSTPLKKILLNP
ncbi:MAG: TIGR00730 family Rossman fold protein [Alphaproteobacteria bacterium]|nr:TIGR00730 family Rossman fold protein [Alphaproteobacteria bacterium]